STAALETLAIIAYKQPITKSEIESIRGVNCDYAVQKLLEKDLVIISGRNEDAVGKPLIYATSKSFMDYFGINSAEDLPKISEVIMEELVKATNVQQAEDNMEAENSAGNIIEGTVTSFAEATKGKEEIIIEETEDTDEADIVLTVTENGEIIEEVNDDNTDKEKEI
ncbi:MAG TPA: SMC-Scp complex subunit ScpB, partial [Ferruginibacter sp.]|nr:SMC-Scp complex subunit ScpB [Ferruginibacter sp.]